MKIVLVGTAYPFRGGGIATFNERLAYALQEAGHEVEIYTFSLQYPNFLFPGKTQYSEEAAPEGLKITITINSVNPFNWIKSGFKIRKLNPDLVIFRYWIPFMAPCLGTISRIVRRREKSRTVAIIDNIIPHEKRPGDRILSTYFVKSLDCFVAISKQVLQDLDKFDTKKPRFFTPHPLYDTFGTLIPREEAMKNLGLDPSFRYILFFGFIRDYKGLDILLNAFADKRFREMPVKVLIAGEFYSPKGPYIEIIEKQNLYEHLVLRTEFIPNSEIAWYFSAADVIVQPYKDATQSGVTQIAYHFERPIITTNVGGLAEIVPDGKVGYVVNPDADELADAMVRFFRENNFEAFSREAAQEKKKYSWEPMVRILTEQVKK